MKVPKKLLKQFVSSTKKNYQQHFKTLYVNESEGYLFFMPSGSQCLFMAFNGNSLPKQIDASAIKGIICKTIEVALPECGDMVDLSLGGLRCDEHDWALDAINFLSKFLDDNTSIAIPDTNLLSFSMLSDMTAFLKAALSETKASAINFNVSYIDTDKYVFKTKTSELEFLCVTAPAVI